MALAKISKSALKHNLNIVKKYAPNSKVVAMVKANAYGHHINKVVPTLKDKVDLFAVANENEIQMVRSLSTKPILLLSGFDFIENWQDFNKNNVQIVIHSFHQLALLKNISNPIKVWLKVDTGMHRLGLSIQELNIVIKELSLKNNIEIIAIMSHFACSDEIANPINQKQLDSFNALKNNFNKSMANSAAILSLPKSHYQFVRPGIMLYGISPFTKTSNELKPVMTLSAPILEIKNINQGESVGYGQTWEAEKNTTIAIIAIGYGDGYPRHAKNGTPVLINKQRCSIVGRVSMDLICVDITNTKAKVGDSAILWGEGLAIEEIAKCSGTIGYELTTKITQRVIFE
ncbi:Alanine racemase [hydrothermal vent metagenome]|uniref:alanine racemase n=1 Tax=hydrothermal vent metagenome TaxID=652676 RepID=A0A1W1CQB5_9ZZZZ